MGGFSFGSCTDVTAGADSDPSGGLCVMEGGAARLVSGPGFNRVSQRISACCSQYRWLTFCTKRFHSVNRTGSSMSAKESLIRSGSAYFSRC